MAKMPCNIVNGGISVRIEDTDLFRDIVELLKDAAEKDTTILPRLAKIMSKHSTEYVYSVRGDVDG